MISSAVAKRFSAGLDIDILLGKSSDEIRPFVQELYVNLFEAQFRLGKPSIAAIGGAARGGGMTLAVSCDVVVASESSSFGYPEIDLGLLPAIHFAHLPRLAGRHRAFELLFSGRTFGPTEAAALGLVTKIVTDAELDDAVQRMAMQFASKSEKVVRMGRAAFMRQIDLVPTQRRVRSGRLLYCRCKRGSAGRLARIRREARAGMAVANLNVREPWSIHTGIPGKAHRPWKTAGRRSMND